MGLSKQFFQIYSVLLFLLFYFYKELPILFSTFLNYNNNNNNNNNNNINTFFFIFHPVYRSIYVSLLPRKQDSTSLTKCNSLVIKRFPCPIMRANAKHDV